MMSLKNEDENYVSHSAGKPFTKANTINNEIPIEKSTSQPQVILRRKSNTDTSSSSLNKSKSFETVSIRSNPF